MVSSRKEQKQFSGRLDLVFSTFIEVTGLITTGASISRITTPILSCMCKILSGKGAFAIIEQRGNLTQLVHRPGRGKRHASTSSEEISSEGPVHKIYRTRKAAFFPEALEQKKLEAVHSVMRSVRGRGLMIGGLEYQGGKAGVMGVITGKGYEPGKEDLALFEILTRQAGTAIKNAEEFERTHMLSITDGLTGAYNYRFLIDAIAKEISRAQRFSEIFSILMLDVDGLKEYNDVHGHLGGSDVIKKVSRIAASCLRSVDMLCKYGGDEFVIVLPRTTKKGAAIAAERLRKAIERHCFPGEEVTGEITSSLGIASYPEDGITVQELISRADQALYSAKRHGRNKVWLSGSKKPYSRG
ncbi:MAG: GGDEF domain-containing protein [bacterium]|jgi:diguanylate cyclase (GGDEF)-like protein